MLIFTFQVRHSSGNSGINRRARTVSEGDSWGQAAASPRQNSHQPYAGRHSAGGGGNANRQGQQSGSGIKL